MMTANLVAPGRRPPLRPMPVQPMRALLRLIAPAALRSSVLIAIAMLLILVLLPVALDAAWTNVVGAR